MSFNLSALFEQVVDVVPDNPALVTATTTLTYRELDQRANRLAHHLAGAGISAGDHVGLHLQNGTEYLEGMLAAFKLRAVPVNINYRYVERELEHLYAHTDLAALIYHQQYGPLVASVAPAVTSLRHLLVVADTSDAVPAPGSVDYTAALAAASPERDFTGRTSDDIYMACTGGTTGLPKGVLWRHEDIFFATMGGGDPTLMEGPITEPGQLSGRVLNPGIVSLITPPFMHVSAHWAAFQMFFGGGKVVVPPPGSFDPQVVWDLVVENGANLITLVGDAMLRPLLDTFAAEPVDASTLMVFASGGAILSKSTKDRARELLPNIIIVDGFGSTETGVTGSETKMPGGEDSGGTSTAFRMDEHTTVLGPDLRRVTAGSGEVGRLARTGRIPLGYYNDERKTAETFVTDPDGVRWVLPGDMASLETDGTIVVHGRGSMSINTGGEKVFPDEVEAALVAHPAVGDVLVVGLPDDRWGQKVVAVIALKPGGQLDLTSLKAHARDHLAGYKVPRDLVVVDRIARNPNGKADYVWAKEQALAALAGTAAAPAGL